MLNLPEPPNATSLSTARLTLSTQRASLLALQTRIADAEQTLADLIAQHEHDISVLRAEQNVLERSLLQTQAYVAPIRRLPGELLSEVFMAAWDDNPCIAWVLAGVSRGWRNTALAMPRIWSKIRLTTTPHASPDTIRLWISRTGYTIPLDVEIFLLNPNRKPSGSSSSTLLVSYPPSPPPPFHSLPLSLPQPGPPHHPMYIHAPSPPRTPPPRHNSHITHPNKSIHWGHVIVFYLVEQMHRWERFVFRFERQFSSMAALKSIAGNAPMLREFEISCASPPFYASSDWPYLPCATAPYALPSLTTLCLRNTPFLPTSPLLLSHQLTSLTLRALPTTHIPVDRILQILRCNPKLQVCRVHFGQVGEAVLPLGPGGMSFIGGGTGAGGTAGATISGSGRVRLEHVKVLGVGGANGMVGAMDGLECPSLRTLEVDIEARDPIEDTITSLLVRSGAPRMEELAVAYRDGIYWGSGAVVTTWGWLGEVGAGLEELRVLRVGGTTLDGVLGALSGPGDGNGGPGPGGGGAHGWLLPKLEKLCLKGCIGMAHSDGMGKLVSMVESRNPLVSVGGGDGSGGGPVSRLKELEMHECAVVGADVMQWLEGRISKVLVCEPVFERPGLSSSPYPY